MTHKKRPAGSPSKDALRSARFVYRRLMRGLETFIERLEAGLGSEDTAAKQKDMIASHFKTLQQIIDLEVALGKRDTSDGAAGFTALDLDAARGEIRDRLSKRAGS
ncbi:MAG: hypothetical protein JKY31_11580 [Rhodobacteraceae bacterium]|nr:hypothetical protein [Paracoccaceae bacterium]